MDLVMLSGGIGGARMARGINALKDVAATVVVNVGDDDLVHGLHVAADLDTVIYTLAGVEGPYGWGRADESWNAMDEMQRLPGADVTFSLGDRDLAVNLYRSGRLVAGDSLTTITRDISTAFGVQSTILPATDDRIRTRIETPSGWLDFQTYFVRRGQRDTLLSVTFEGIEDAHPAPGVIEAIETADVVVIAPSNPILSVWPILGIPGMREAISSRPTIAVSPLIGGRAVKGPAVASLAAYDLPPTPDGIVAAYEGLLDAIVVDPGDRVDIPGVEVLARDILISEPTAALALAEDLASWAR